MQLVDEVLSRARVAWGWARPLLLHILTGDPEGLISFSWKSRATILTLAAWTFMVPCGVNVCYVVLVQEIERSQVKSHSVQEFSQLMVLTFTTLFDILLPIPVFVSMRSFTNFTASWTRMEVKYTTLTGAPPRLGIKPFVYTLFVVSQVYFISVLVALHDQMGLAFWMMVPLTHATTCMLSCVVIWVSGYIAVAVLSYGLNRRLIADTERQGVAGLRLHRLLWLHTVKARESRAR
ncbi:Gustatory and odorant receptor 22, partial [Frankliniella fusca]